MSTDSVLKNQLVCQVRETLKGAGFYDLRWGTVVFLEEDTLARWERARVASKASPVSGAVQKSLRTKVKSLRESLTPQKRTSSDPKGPQTWKPRFRTEKIETTEGGQILLICLPGEFRTIDLHETIRENVSPCFKGSFSEHWNSTLHIDLEFVSEKNETLVMDALGALAVLKDWDYPHFGRRGDGKAKLGVELAHGPMERGFGKLANQGIKKGKTSAKEKKKTVRFEVVVRNKKNQKEDLVKGAILARGTNLVRTLAELPTNLLRPKLFRQELEDRSRRKKYKFRFQSRTQLQKLGAEAFLSVGRGGDGSDGIAHLSFGGATAKGRRQKKRRVALVGKGVCYDTGGYNIKTGGYMYGMHRDMTGSAVALALFEALKDLGLPLEVHAFLGLTENLISEDAFRPNEVVRALNGSSIEVVDTDAEGRMVLADVLAIASEVKPDLIIDFATLTGAAVRSIGTKRSAIFSNHEGLLESAQLAGTQSGEQAWGFPLGQEYFDDIKSNIADILQCSPSPGTDHIHAASFLSHFVVEGIPWLHVDLCPETHSGGLGLVSSETTGYGVRLGSAVIDSFLL